MSGNITKNDQECKFANESAFFARKYLISIIAFRDTFSRARDPNRIDKEAVVWLLSFSVKNASASNLNCCVSLATSVASAAVSIKTAETLVQKTLLRSYSEVGNYVFKKFTSSRTTAKEYSPILRYT